VNAFPWIHIGANEFRLGNILTVKLRSKQLKLNKVYNIINGTAPIYLNTAFKLITSQRNINTRSSTMSFQIPQVKSFGIWPHGKDAFSEFLNIFNTQELSIKFKFSICIDSVNYLATSAFKDPKTIIPY